MANPPPPVLPPIATLSTADDATLKSVLDLLFEPSSTLHELCIPRLRERVRELPPTLTTYAALIQDVGSLLSSLASQSQSQSQSQQSSRATLHAILGAHPRLGEKKVASALSRAEQAQLNATSPSTSTSPSTPSTEERQRQEEAAAERQLLADLNAEYEARFPGLRYVVFVNGRARPAILADMRERIARGDAAAEEREAIAAMVDIALDRARKLGGGG